MPPCTHTHSAVTTHKLRNACILEKVLAGNKMLSVSFVRHTTRGDLSFVCHTTRGECKAQIADFDFGAPHAGTAFPVHLCSGLHFPEGACRHSFLRYICECAFVLRPAHYRSQMTHLWNKNVRTSQMSQGWPEPYIFRYIRCIYGIFGREITIHAIVYVVYIRLWPTLQMWDV